MLFFRLWLTRNKLTLWQHTPLLFLQKFKQRPMRTSWKVTVFFFFKKKRDFLWNLPCLQNLWCILIIRTHNTTLKRNKTLYNCLIDIVDMKQRQKCLELASSAGMFVYPIIMLSLLEYVSLWTATIKCVSLDVYICIYFKINICRSSASVRFWCWNKWKT